MTLRNVSASQVTAFKLCQRLWYYGWVQKLRAPKTSAMQRGTDIHTEIEHYLKTANFRDSSYEVLDDETGELLTTLNYRPYVEALAPLLPPPQHPELIIEHEFSMDLSLYGELPPWNGYIDQGFSSTDWPRDPGLAAFHGFGGNDWPVLTLGDVKSISDFRYCKKPEELKRDTQLCSYGAWALGEGHDGSLALGHFYLLTEKKRVPKKPKVLPRFVVVTRDEVLNQFENDIDIVREMVVAGKASSAQDVEPTGAPHSCSKMFGRPCPHRARCGFDVEIKKGSLTMGFMDKFKGNGNQKPAQAAPVPPVQQQAAPPTPGRFMSRLKGETPAAVPTGTLPPDAPSRETPVAAAPAVEEKKARKPRKAKADGLTLYLGCAPRKGGGEIILFEDFIAPVIAELNEYVQKEKNVSHYRFLDFSEEKALFSMAVAEKFANIGADLVVLNPGSAEWKDAMTAIIPHAVTIIQ